MSLDSSAPNPLTQLLESSPDQADLLGAVHTPREIAQQPASWRVTARSIRHERSLIQKLLPAAKADGPARSVVLIGAGSSHHVSESVAALWRQRLRCTVTAIASTDLLTHARELLPEDARHFFVSFSRSGASPESVAVIERLLGRWPESPHLILTCSAQGPMRTQFVDHAQVSCLLLDDAVNDRGLAMTSSFSNMVIAAQGLVEFEQFEAWSRRVDLLAHAAQGLLERAPNALNRLLERGFSSACFLGSGPLKAVAHESALKLLELSAGSMKTMSDSFLGVRHGPLSALDRSSLLVGHLSSAAELRRYELDLVSEVQHKKLCKAVLLVSPEEDPRARSLADLLLILGLPREIDDSVRPPLDVIVGQLLGLFASLRCGLRPDAPSPNSAIERVVSGVHIYAQA